MNVRAIERSASDSGSATVWVLLAATAVWTVATWGLALASVASARAAASTAADLAALAGAERALLGERAACAQVRTVAAANRASVRSCAVDPVARTVEVVVEVGRRGVLAHAGPALARARAGPEPP